MSRPTAIQTGGAAADIRELPRILTVALSSRRNVRRLLAAAVFACLAIAARGAPEGNPSIHIPVTQLHYASTGITAGVHGETQAAPAYGDLAHGMFIKLPAGFVSPIHIHTGDYHGVVVSGVAVNVAIGGTKVPLPVGSYWFQRGGERHVTKCISSNECIFFISQSAKFDYLLDKAME